MEVKITIKTYEFNGEEKYEKEVELLNHWNRREDFTIKIGKDEYTFNANEFKLAIEKVTNCRI